MGRGIWWAVMIGVMSVACGDDDDDVAPGLDAAVGVDAGADAAARDAAADAEVPDTGVDAAVPGGFGADCAYGDECDSGSCFAPIAAFGVGTGYCTKSCASDEDCSGDPTPHPYACVGEGDEAQCLRTCDDGFGCTETEICLADFVLPMGTNDICIDLKNDLCESDGDCTDEFCLPLGDRDSVVKACFAPRDQFSAVMDLMPPGSGCDPALQAAPIACRFPRDCPDGWDCRPPGPGLWDQCMPPPEEQCSLFCMGVGLCSGLCESDDQCPTDMICGRVSLTLFTQGTNAVYDDQFLEMGVCQYAAGSLTPCSSEDDCAATGAAGARETCTVMTDLAGDAANACVTPRDGVGLPGDPCGDDPATPAIEAGGFCHGVCFESRCAGVCETNDDCPADPGVQCSPLNVGPREPVSFCFDREPCTLDADCGGGDVCHPYFDAVSVDGECGPPIGTLAAGDTCNVGPPSLFPESERCANGLCQFLGRGRDAGVCSTMCTGDGDCSPDNVCISGQLTVDGQGTLDRADDLDAPISRCAYAPGSRTSCVTEVDCGDGETCVLAPVDGAFRGLCVTEVEDGRTTGQGCGFAIACASTMCQDPWTGTAFCTELCDESSDCPADYECRTFEDDLRVERNLCFPLDDPRGVAVP